MIIIILLAVSPFVNPSTLFEINPVSAVLRSLECPTTCCLHSHSHPLQILETASVSRMRCADLSNIVGFQRCASPVELPSSRFYEVKIAVYLYLDARTSASGAQLSCSTHVCDCAAQSPCLNCNVDGAKEHLCRARIDQSDAGTHTVILFGFVNPSDASEPISLASRFAFRVYASTNDGDGAAALEGTVASLGPWFEFNHRWVLHPDGDDDSPPDALHHAGVHEDGSGVFSRVACTGVTHDFEQGEDIIRNWDGHRGGGYMSSRQNVCVFENVCLSGGGVLSMYLPPHPEGLPSESTAYNEERNHIGYVRLSSFESWEGRYSQTYSGNATQGDYAGWRPDVKRASIPKTFRFAQDAELHVFQRHSHFFQNYGHLLLDDLLAAFAGMELFSIATLNATLVLMPDCPCCFPETAHELCARFFWNNDSMSRSLFVGGAKQLTAYSDGTCFKKVLMGHSSALSCAYPNPLLSVVVRKFRAALVSGVVGESARYHSHQWLRGTEAALMNISGEQVRPTVVCCRCLHICRPLCFGDLFVCRAFHSAF